MQIGVLGSVLRAAIGMMDAVLCRLPAGDRSSERRQCEAGIDASADCVAEAAGAQTVRAKRWRDRP
jgi:hypothetical protein